MKIPPFQRDARAQGVNNWAVHIQNSKIQYGGSNMTDQNVKIYLIGITTITRGFSKSFANLYLKFRNLKWRTKM